MAKKTGIEWDIPVPTHAGHTLEVWAPEPHDFMPGMYRLVCSCGEAVWFLNPLDTRQFGSFSPYALADETGRDLRARLGTDLSGIPVPEST